MTSVKHDHPTAPLTIGASPPSRVRRFVDGLLVFAVLALNGAWPVPEINEPHYLMKAAHFWDPQSCERDIFLTSRDSHVVFFATIGWLTRFVSLEATAWIGRIVAWALLAWGWRRLSFAVVPRFGMAAVTAAAMLAANRYGEMAGEWFVGGVEAKCFAYAFVFAGLAEVLASCWNRGLMLLGIGTAFHVLVGGWSLVAVGGVWLLDGPRRPSLASLVPGLIVGAALSAAGLVPGLLLNRGVPAEVVAEAERIYVEERIAHHLDPRAFLPDRGYCLAAIATAYCILCRLVSADERRRRLRSFAGSAAVLVLIGLAIGYGLSVGTPLRASLLKYYWFRLADVALPAALVLETATLAVAAGKPALRFAATAVLLLAGAWNLGAISYVRAQTPMARGENLYDAANLEGWREACTWIRENTEHDALVLAPRSFHTFKWYARRAEFATWKDVPQDAASLVEWKRRLDRLYPADSPHWVNYLQEEHLREVCREYEVDYVVAYVLPPLELPIVYLNNDFAVYEVPRDGRAAARGR